MWRWIGWGVLVAMAALWGGCSGVPLQKAPRHEGEAPASPSALPSTVIVATPVRQGETTQPATAVPRVTPVPSGTPVREMPAPGILPKVRNTPLPFPQPGDAQLGVAPVDLTAFTAAGVSGGKVKLTLQGNLPTPCHRLRVSVERVEGTLQVKVYSVVNPQQTCAQVLQPFSVVVKAGPFPDGDYRVLVNGRLVGKVVIKH